eukprot:m.79214 g.79214  ORF g.79214 m.79214 type:complete len:373 (-) comp14781_c2_seq1:14-1132(-)
MTHERDRTRRTREANNQFLLHGVHTIPFRDRQLAKAAGTHGQLGVQQRVDGVTLGSLLLLSHAKLRHNKALLLLRSALKDHYTEAHVVLATLQQAVLQHPLADLRRSEPALQLVGDKLAGLLIGDHVPDAVAAEHEELVVLRPPQRGHVCQRGDDLLLVRQVRLVLVCVVAERARHSKIAAHTPNLYVPTGRVDTLLLRLVGGFVVLGAEMRLASAAENSARVAAVADHYVCGGDKGTNRRGAAAVAQVLQAWQFAQLAVHRKVTGAQAILQAVFHRSGCVLELGGLHNGWQKLSRTLLRDGGAAVSVKHCEKRYVRQAVNRDNGGVRVLHFDAPALHRRHAILDAVTLALFGGLVGDRLVQKCAHGCSSCC